MSAIAYSIGVFHASQLTWTIFIDAAQIERMLLVGAWINEDVEQLDTPVLNMGDVSPRHGHGAISRTRAPPAMPRICSPLPYPVGSSSAKARSRH
jgi:hypothetical protein